MVQIKYVCTVCGVKHSSAFTCPHYMFEKITIMKNTFSTSRLEMVAFIDFVHFVTCLSPLGTEVLKFAPFVGSGRLSHVYPACSLHIYLLKDREVRALTCLNTCFKKQMLVKAQ